MKMVKKKPLSPALPWKTRITIFLLDIIMNLSCGPDGTVNRCYFRVFKPFLNVKPKTANGVRVTDIIIDSKRDLWFRLFVPTDNSEESKLPVLIYFHGGGFCFFSPDLREFDTMCRQFSRKIPAVVVSVNYRLSPEHPFPSAYHDGFDTLRFLDENYLDEFPVNTDLSRCFLAGDSAGGNIVHHVARRLAESDTEFSELKVVGLIAIQPFFGGEERTESETELRKVPILSLGLTDWYWKAFLPQGASRDHEAVNVFGPKSADISGLKSFPATLVFVGGFDPLNDSQKRYYKWLKRCGKTAQLVEYPNAIHAFYTFQELPEASLLVTEMTSFIHNCGEIMK